MMTRLTDGSPNGILLLDASWRIVYANQTAQRLARLKPEDLNKVIFWEMYPGVPGTSLEPAMREAAGTGLPQVVKDYYYQPFDIWVDVNLQPSAAGLGIYFRDVSATAKLQAARDQMAQQLNQVLEATTDSVMAIDRNWTILYINPRGRAALVHLGELVGRNFWECFPESAAPDSSFFLNYHRAMDEGLPGSFQAFYAESINGWFDVIVRPSRDGIILFYRDVTHQKRAEAALVEVEKLAVVARLATTIAHQINNPLASVTNLVYLAKMLTEGSEVHRYLELAEQELRRVAVLTSQSLRFHKQLTAPHPVESPQLFTQVIRTFESKLHSLGIQVESRHRATHAVTCFDGEIAQVLHELIDNALAGMADGCKLLIRSRESTDGGTGRKGVLLTIADTGKGIAAGDQGRVFDAFFTTKGIRSIGLGLWISRDIVRRHQGRLRIRSKVGADHHGTLVTVFLPFEQAAA
jgi:signal transduction histidine kinase